MVGGRGTQHLSSRACGVHVGPCREGWGLDSVPRLLPLTGPEGSTLRSRHCGCSSGGWRPLPLHPGGGASNGLSGSGLGRRGSGPGREVASGESRPSEGTGQAEGDAVHRRAPCVSCGGPPSQPAFLTCGPPLPSLCHHKEAGLARKWLDGLHQQLWTLDKGHRAQVPRSCSARSQGLDAQWLIPVPEGRRPGGRVWLGRMGSRKGSPPRFAGSPILGRARCVCVGGLQLQ